MTTTPLTVAELAATLAAIGGFEARPEVAVAVSGGPDSLALILLADRWARRRGGRAWGLTVDHGLRPESADEARIVAGWLAARDIRHEILRWGGDKPASGIQEAAREARYRLLAAWCRKHGVLHLLTAHHREDQAETHLIRRRAKSGVDGLAAISVVRELSGCRLVRPLLAVPKARLAALLAAEGQQFLRDPSNLNPAFERARLRFPAAVVPGSPAGRGPESIKTRLWAMDSGSAPLARPGMTNVDEIIDVTRARGHQRIERERALYDLIGRAVALHPAGFAAIDQAAIATADADMAEQLLGRIAACVGGAQYPARRVRLARLRAALAAQPQRARTLGGCRFVPWRRQILVLRETAAAQPPVRLDPGACLVWDHRFTARLPPTATSGFSLGYLGERGIAAIDRSECDRNREAATLPGLLLPVLPVLHDEAGLAAIPHLCYRRRGVEALPHLSFRPANPLTPTSFTVV